MKDSDDLSGSLFEELHELTEACLNETATPEQVSRLDHLVSEDERARYYYVRYVQTSCDLRAWAESPLETSVGGQQRGRRQRLAWFVSAAVTLLILTTAVFFIATRRSSVLQASLVATQGNVRITKDDTCSPAEPGVGIRFNDRIQTGADGSADVRLADGTNVRVDADTDITFASQQDSRRLNLKVGEIRCDVTPQPPGKSLVFLTPHIELTVLGTAFELMATPVQSRVRVLRGRVRLAAGGQNVEVAENGQATADAQGLHAWTPVCDLDFRAMKTLPSQLETVFCDAQSLHTPQRKILPAPDNAILERGGLRLDDTLATSPVHGLLVTRWTEKIGGDVAIEVDVSAGKQWSLGLAVDGDSFQGYRIVFIAPDYPNGISVDSIYPIKQTLLAQDPRPIPHERDHTLRVEKRGPHIRVWVDRELRIDTEVAYPLAQDRKQTFAISNFGFAPHIRSLRVWKAAGESTH